MEGPAPTSSEFLIHPSSLSPNPAQATPLYPSLSPLPCQVCKILGCASEFQDVPGSLLSALLTHTPKAQPRASPCPELAVLCGYASLSHLGLHVGTLLILNEIKTTSISEKGKLKVREKKTEAEKLLAESSNPSRFKHTFPETGN